MAEWDAQIDAALGGGDKTPAPAQDLGALYSAAGAKWGLDPLLLRAIAKWESKEDPGQNGPVIAFGPDKGTKAKGLMQVTDSNWKALGGGRDPYDFASNLDVGAQVLRQQLDANRGAWEPALQGYSGGAQGYAASIQGLYKSLGGNAWGAQAGAQAGAPAGAQAQGPAPGPWDAQIDSALSSQADTQALEASLPDQEGKRASNAPWGWLDSYINGALWGDGVDVGAAAQATKYAIQNWRNGMPLSDAIDLAKRNVFPDARAVAQSAKEAYEAGHPQGAAWAGVLGSTTTLVPALAAGEGALAAGGRAFGAALPDAAGVLAPVGRFLMGTSEGAFPTRVASQAALGARQGLEAAALEGDTSHPGENAAVGAGVQALAYPFFGPATKYLFADVNPQTSEIARGMNRLGVPVTGGQLLGEGAGKVASPGQLEAYTRAALRTAGSDDARVGVDTIRNARGQAGRDLDYAAARTQVNPFVVNSQGHTLTSRLADTVASAQAHPLLQAYPAKVQTVERLVDSIHNAVDPATMTIPGNRYQELTRSDSPLDQAIHDTDPVIADFGRQIRRHLDEGLEASSHPQDVAFLRDARLRYKNAVALEPAARRAVGTGGVINPADVVTGVQRTFRGGSLDAGDLGVLSRGVPLMGGAKPSATGDVPPKGHILSHIPAGGKLAASLGALGVAAEFLPELESLAMHHPIAAGAVAAGAARMVGKKAADYMSRSPTAGNMLLGVPGARTAALVAGLHGLRAAPLAAATAIYNEDDMGLLGRRAP